MLRSCRNRATLRRSLETLPPTLDKTYDRILCAISNSDSPYAIRVLRWLTFSFRPLSVGEVAEIVAIDPGRNPSFDREEVLEDPLNVWNICSSLVTVTQEIPAEKQTLALDKNVGQIVSLAHYSVKEYLRSDRTRNGPAAQYAMQDTACHNAMTAGCLGYLLQFQDPELF